MTQFFSRLINTIKYSIQWFSNVSHITPHLWKLFRLQEPRVTFFGSSKIALNDRYAQDARKLAYLCVQNGWSIITGGGGGIMQAAAQGAQDAKSDATKILGISLVGIEEGAEYEAAHAKSFMRIKGLTERKWLMVNFSKACIFFPGGVGTQNELAEIMTLIDLKLIAPKPIILYGAEYWQPLLAWMQTKGLQNGLVSQDVLNTIVLVDHVARAFEQLKQIISKK